LVVIQFRPPLRIALPYFFAHANILPQNPHHEIQPQEP
jgi:hypothetical protein